MSNGPTFDEFCEMVMQLRRIGAPIRTIAGVFGMSKSTLHRWMPAIEARASQMGQGRRG
jgi:transposase-like protein